MFKLITKNADIINNTNNICWSSNIDTLGTQLTFDTIKDLYEGQVVSLWQDSNEIIRGIVIKKTENNNTFSYVVQDYSFYLKNKVGIIQFNKQSADSCIRKLIEDCYLVGSISEMATEITQIYRGQSIAQIIDDILEKAEADQGKKYICEIEGNKLFIYELQDLKIVPNVVIGEFSKESSIENMKNDIQVISSEEKYNSIVASATDESLYYWYGKLTETITVDADNVAQAQNIALNKLKELNVITRTSSIPLIVLDEKVNIKANRLIYINKGDFNGYYKIKSARHTLANGLHKCDIEITYDYPHTNVTSQYTNTDVINQIISDNANKSKSSSSSSSSGSGTGYQIVEYAKQFLGTPYVWGGTTPSGFDCSGFTQYVYNHFGISIPRTTYEQIKCGTQTSNPSPGDLFFPHTGHVGIYIGNGQVIHSPKTGDVIKISNAWGRDSGFPKYVHVSGV